MIPPIRFAQSSRGGIAYQSVGDHEQCLVVVPPLAQNIEKMWEQPICGPPGRPRSFPPPTRWTEPAARRVFVVCENDLDVDSAATLAAARSHHGRQVLTYAGGHLRVPDPREFAGRRAAGSVRTT